MYRIILFWSLFFSVLTASAQRIDTDIFGNLIYESRDRNYRAKMEKNIFDHLIFTDSRNNKLTFEKKYLDSELSNIQRDKDVQIDFFNDLIREYKKEKHYVATYKVDIFDKIIFEDNRGNTTKRGKDIFGHDQYEKESNGVKTTVKRNIHGNLEYSRGSEKATLKKDIFDRWTYEDSLGNKFQFAPRTWERLLYRLRSEEDVFWTLIDQFFAS